MLSYLTALLIGIVPTSFIIREGKWDPMKNVITDWLTDFVSKVSWYLSQPSPSMLPQIKNKKQENIKQ